MKIVFLSICVFLALAGVAGLPAPLLARKFAEDQNDQKNTRGMRYLRYEEETNARLTKRSPVAPLVKLTSELLAKRYEDEGDAIFNETHWLTKRSPVAPLVELTSELLAVMQRYKDEENTRLTKRSPAPLVDLTSELLAGILEGIYEPRIYSGYESYDQQSPVSPTLTRRKRDDFDLAEAEADPRKKRSPEGDARKKLAAEAEADPRKKRSPEGDARKKLAAEANHRRNKRSPFEVASESDTVSRVSVRETEAYP